MVLETLWGIGNNWTAGSGRGSGCVRPPCFSRIHCLRFLVSHGRAASSDPMSRPTGACLHAWRLGMATCTIPAAAAPRAHVGRHLPGIRQAARPALLLPSFSSSTLLCHRLPPILPLVLQLLRVRANHAMAASAGTVYEADAEAVVRRITPALDRARHKGQAGQYRRPSWSPHALRSMSQCVSCGQDVDARGVFDGIPWCWVERYEMLGWVQLTLDRLWFWVERSGMLGSVDRLLVVVFGMVVIVLACCKLGTCLVKVASIVVIFIQIRCTMFWFGLLTIPAQ